MADINVSYKNAGARGTPAFEVMDSYVDSNLVAGATPPVSQPVRILLGDSLTLAQFSVVAIVVATKKLALATVAALADGSQQLAGVLMHAATSGAANSTIYGEVSLEGCFNADLTGSPLVWDASFDTLAERVAITQGNSRLMFRSRLGADAS